MDEIAKLLPEEIRNLVLITPLLITIFLCISAGAVLKRAHFFDDNKIPFILGPIGAVIYVVLVKYMNQDYRASMWGLNAIWGLFVGWNSVGIHQVIRNSEWLSKLPLLKILVPPTGNTEFHTKAPEPEQKP